MTMIVTGLTMAGVGFGLGYIAGALAEERLHRRVEIAMLRPLPGIWRERAVNSAERELNA